MKITELRDFNCFLGNYERLALPDDPKCVTMSINVDEMDDLPSLISLEILAKTSMGINVLIDYRQFFGGDFDEVDKYLNNLAFFVDVVFVKSFDPKVFFSLFDESFKKLKNIYYVDLRQDLIIGKINQGMRRYEVKYQDVNAKPIFLVNGRYYKRSAIINFKIGRDDNFEIKDSLQFGFCDFPADCKNEYFLELFSEEITKEGFLKKVRENNQAFICRILNLCAQDIFYDLPRIERKKRLEDLKKERLLAKIKRDEALIELLQNNLEKNQILFEEKLIINNYGC